VSSSRNCSSRSVLTKPNQPIPNPSYLVQIDQVKELAPDAQEELNKVAARFAFRSNSYYQSLIDWNDENDPIRRIIIPDQAELIDWGMLDASHESSFTVAPGVEHKYSATALLLVTNVCGGYCRFCFRKRLFMPENDETVNDISEGVQYIATHSEITNVLLTGGDPLILSTRRLSDIFTRLSAIPHVGIIRIGSKMPAFNPARIINDESLLDAIREFSQRTCIYIMCHFNHPRELTPEAIMSLKLLQSAGAITANQTPLIRGINDDAKVLADLFNLLARSGTSPYYVFQCRPTLGNADYAVPVEHAYGIFAAAQADCSGLAKRARFVMSHETGKVEVIGLTPEHIYMRYHEAADRRNVNRLLALQSNRKAYWLDDYDEIRSTERVVAMEEQTVPTSSLPL
jgi:lysine 2,3-aminomutase